MSPLQWPLQVAIASEQPVHDHLEQRHDAAPLSQRALYTLDPTTHLSSSIRRRLRCPACGRRLFLSREELGCNNTSCGMRYPIVDGIPVMIDESKSLFDVADFVAHRTTTWPVRPWITRQAVRWIPDLGLKLHAERNLAAFAGLLPRRREQSQVLVIGGRSLGQGMEQLLASPTIELVETDVAFGPRTRLICDGHALPFADSTFDGVIIQAVLQYVQDPQRVVSEIHRVLVEDGVVYAEVPFVQHALEGYDYNRFTLLGLHRLFRSFAEVSAGPLVGPATMLSWSVQYFFLSFVSGRAARAMTKAITRLAFPWLKYFDRLLIGRPGAADAAGELSYLGTRSEHTLSDRELAHAHRKFW